MLPLASRYVGQTLSQASSKLFVGLKCSCVPKTGRNQSVLGNRERRPSSQLLWHHPESRKSCRTYHMWITIFARKPKLGKGCKPACRQASCTPASPEVLSGQEAFKPVCHGEGEQGVHCWGTKQLMALLCSSPAQPRVFAG